jgi:predicted RNA-binding Zn-ribbon protein involved in translation (DUF1610 family)
MDSFNRKSFLPLRKPERKITCKGCGEPFTVESDRIRFFCPDCRVDTFNQQLGRKIKEMEEHRVELVQHYRAKDYKAGLLDQALTMARDMRLTIPEALQRLAEEGIGSGGSSGGIDPGSPAYSPGKGARRASVQSSTIRRPGSE